MSATIIPLGEVGEPDDGEDARDSFAPVRKQRNMLSPDILPEDPRLKCGGQAPIWKLFRILDEDFDTAFCLGCRCGISRRTGTTTNMLKHARSCEPGRRFLATLNPIARGEGGAISRRNKRKQDDLPSELRKVARQRTAQGDSGEEEEEEEEDAPLPGRSAAASPDLVSALSETVSSLSAQLAELQSMVQGTNEEVARQAEEISELRQSAPTAEEPSAQLTALKSELQATAKEVAQLAKEIARIKKALRQPATMAGL